MNKILEKTNPNTLLLIGVLTIIASHVSYSVDIVAWFSSVPFLLYLYQTKGRKSRLLLSLALFVAWSLATAKIITAPIPFAMVFLFSLPLTLIHLPAYLIWDKFKSHQYAMFLFPIIFVIMEWIQYSFMPFASWGVAANTQSHSIVMLQSLSLFGMAGLSFLIYWINISIVELIQNRKINLLNCFLPLGILLVFLIYGSLRIDFWKASSKETVTVAAVGTDSEISSPPFADAETNNRYKNALMSRTAKAARQGSKLVSWNEASIFIEEQDEKTWKDSIQSLAKNLHISLIASYVVPKSNEPLKLENKLLAINSSGEIVYQYLKHLYSRNQNVRFLQNKTSDFM